MSIRYFIDLVEGRTDEAGWWPSRKQTSDAVPQTGPGVVTTTKTPATSRVTTTIRKESSEAITQLKQASYNVRTRRNLDQSIDAVEYYAKVLRKMAIDQGMGQFVPMLDAILADPENADSVDRFASAFEALMATDTDFHHTEYRRVSST
jgi:hypothetical protein